MRFLRTFALAGVTVAMLLAFTAPARADVIDGTWCSPDGDVMVIAGAEVTTPGGKRVAAGRTRHSANYEIPEGEADAGGKIYAEQLSETTIRVTLIKKLQEEPGAHKEWKRCSPVS